MEYQYFGTDDFLDGFYNNHYKNPEQISDIHKYTEESLWVFSAKKHEQNSLLEFGYACAYERYIKEIEFMKSKYIRTNIPMPPYTTWDNYKKQFIQYPLTKETFGSKLAFCICGLKNPPDISNYEQVKSAMILVDDWDCVFVIAEFKDCYIGYLWKS